MRYCRGDTYTNTVEGFFSIFKRGMKGVHQHCSEKHLYRYLAEFDRYSHRIALGVDDEARTAYALEGLVGKRLTYCRPDERPEAVETYGQATAVVVADQGRRDAAKDA